MIQHVSGPRYQLTVKLDPSPTGTRVGWTQVFEHPEVAKRSAPIVIPAREQNRDRWVVSGGGPQSSAAGGPAVTLEAVHAPIARLHFRK